MIFVNLTFYGCLGAKILIFGRKAYYLSMNYGMMSVFFVNFCP